jgi:hypothetical protein
MYCETVRSKAAARAMITGFIQPGTLVESFRTGTFCFLSLTLGRIVIAMTREELDQWVNDEGFNPFVVTAFDGFALPVTSPRQVLVGNSMIVIKHTDGHIYHIPFRSIAHISEKGKELG